MFNMALELPGNGAYRLAGSVREFSCPRCDGVGYLEALQTGVALSSLTESRFHADLSLCS